MQCFLFSLRGGDAVSCPRTIQQKEWLVMEPDYDKRPLQLLFIFHCLPVLTEKIKSDVAVHSCSTHFHLPATCFLQRQENDEIEKRRESM